MSGPARRILTALDSQMMTTRTAVRTLLVAAAVLAAASPAVGQTPEVSFRAGRVTITARDTPLAAILDAWERQGGSRFVDAGRLANRSISVHMVEVPEREALRVLLRSAGGYVAVPRTSRQPGASAFDRIFIMAGSGRPQAAPVPGPAGGAASGLQPPGRLPAAGGAPVAEIRPADLDGSDELDEMDELELVESLRRRVQSAAPADREAEPAGFLSRPDGGALRSAPRPGMVIEADEPRNRPNPVRRRTREP